MENKSNKLDSIADIQDQMKRLSEVINAKCTRLALEEQKLEQEKSIFNSTYKILMSFNDPITLNVGGQIFTTSLTTLTREDSMLKAMFSGRHSLKKGNDGAYFIDRDPKHFRQVLNFLRDGEIEITNDVEREEIMREAKFYSFDALVKYVTPATKIVSTILEPSLPLAFDPKNKGRLIRIEGATASSIVGREWQSAFTQSFTKGIHSISVTPDNEIFIGICGASIAHAFKGGAHVQDYSMMLHSSGTLYVTRKAKQLSSFSPGSSVRVELDCDKRTVTWSFGSNHYKESLHSLMQAPFTFCVDLSGSTTVTMTSLH